MLLVFLPLFLLQKEENSERHRGNERKRSTYDGECACGDNELERLRCPTCRARFVQKEH